MTVRKAYQGAVDMVGEMPESVEYAPHPTLCSLTAGDYKRMGAEWERWAKKLARQAGELLTELDGRDEKARKRWIKKQEKQLGIKLADFRAGKWEMELSMAREMGAAYTAMAKSLLGDAPNYTETKLYFDTKIAESPETYTLVVQRHAPGALTPHEARQKAERERDKARAIVTRVERAVALADVDADGSEREAGFNAAMAVVRLALSGREVAHRGE